MAPDGQAAAQDGFRQCSQMRGRKNMNAFSYSSRTVSDTLARIGSLAASSLPPASESSQLADHEIFVSFPVISDLGRATGVCSPAGAVSRCSYSYVQGS